MAFLSRLPIWFHKRKILEWRPLNPIGIENITIAEITKTTTTDTTARRCTTIINVTNANWCIIRDTLDTICHTHNIHFTKRCQFSSRTLCPRFSPSTSLNTSPNTSRSSNLCRSSSTLMFNNRTQNRHRRSSNQSLNQRKNVNFHRPRPCTTRRVSS